jgi:hypothetical protein
MQILKKKNRSVKMLKPTNSVSFSNPMIPPELINKKAAPLKGLTSESSAHLQ